MKAAFLDPNPVIMLEHKGLYWSKVPGTEDAKSAEPSRDYVLPLGKGNVVLKADEIKLKAAKAVASSLMEWVFIGKKCCKKIPLVKSKLLI